ncbi:MAG: alternative ribosome rescue aminoacyl-tRNA hydrolase ArfB [Alphaproteobacteria bacterium]|jgi:ribosome-associated protein|nr:alternative ribosome rescue aminoacyl-tRNA hydrolase ArfB [Alphaproteobacteria bacterium]
MIPVTHRIQLDERELEESFIRASGPGGQNVNKVSTAVQLRFNARGSPNLPDDVAIRLLKLAGHRATQDGVIVITAQEFRSQDRNRSAAREILFELIRRATVVPIKRRATRPTLGSKERRLDAKKSRSGIKAARRPPSE